MIKISSEVKSRISRFVLAALFLLGPFFTVHATRVVNPVLWADVPDPDVIRVGDTFYMVSTTMHLMPGAPIMESKDLVHWETTHYIFDRLTDMPKYDLIGGTVYGRGQWATSLKYHKGHFYALFSTDDSQGGDSYLFETTDPHKGWKLKNRLPHFHDPSLFFDDDDRVYVFSGSGYITELKSDLSGVKEGGLSKLLFKRDSTENFLLEGSRAIKKDGRYYLLMISWPAGKPRRQVCYRADSLNGQWVKKVILESEFGGFSYVGQGTIVDDAKGNWYGIIFQDRGGVGRVLTLNPCRWIDGWPILGDAKDKVPESFDIPLAEGRGHGVVSGDDFSGKKLNLDWEWNHNPVDEAWSLSERKGYLRLKTSKIAQNIFAARNTLTQRLQGPTQTSTVLLDLSNMRPGDRAGLSAFNSDAGMLELTPQGSGYSLKMVTESVHLSNQPHDITGVDRTEVDSVVLSKGKVWLRMAADFRPGQDWARFSYSTDGVNFRPLGTPFKMVFDYRRFFMGSRVAIYNYATTTTGGWIDVDQFLIDQ